LAFLFNCVKLKDVLSIHNFFTNHTLSKQMGNSVRMLEQHYSKLTATMAAEKLA
jgi:hypothetical protein